MERMLKELFGLPLDLLGAEAWELERRLGGPTLIHLPGQRAPALFVSVLMHGNETVGWEAIRRLLARYQTPEGPDLPRALSLFIGNVRAAAQGLRRLPDQPDYNRVWPGGLAPPCPERRLMQRVVDIMAARGLFASVDLHNNTGINPHYACVNALDNRCLQLATLFGRIVVYFLHPKGVQSMAMTPLAPSVTLECGKVGQEHGVTHALEYLEACLRLAEIPDHPVATHDIDLFHTVAQVKLPPSLRFGLAEDADLRFIPELDRLNFRELPAGTPLGQVRDGLRLTLEVRDDQGRDLVERYFEVVDRELRVRMPVMPSMLTLDAQVIRQDCLCYLMERYDHRLPG